MVNRVRTYPFNVIQIRYILIVLFLLFSLVIYGQNEGKEALYALTSFTKRVRTETSEMQLLIPDAYRTHPEYGMLPPGAPCEDCFELIHLRSDSSRHFVKTGSGGTHFFKQYGYGSLHYRNTAGELISIRAHLSPDQTGGYLSEHQKTKMYIQPGSGVVLTEDSHSLKICKNLQLVYVDESGGRNVMFEANWSNYTAGDDGLYIYDLFPGIDLRLLTEEGRFKYDYIIRQNTAPAGSSLLIEEEPELQGLTHNMTEGTTFTGDISVQNLGGIEIFKIHEAYGYDSKSEQQNIPLPYVYTSGRLGILIPADVLSDTTLVYPFTVDPLVTSSQSLAQASITGAGYSSVCFQNGCPYTMVVPTPANATVTNVLNSFNYVTMNTNCWMSNGAFDLQLGTCRSPSSVTQFWSCPLNSTGTCTFSNLSVMGDLGSCLSATSCTPQNLSFTMRFYQCKLNAFVCNNICIAAQSAWTITLEGKTVEIGSISPSQNICQGQSASLTAQAAFGIGPYSYSWSPGNISGQTVTVSPSSTTTYTVTATDACGNTSTSTTTVNVIAGNNPGFTINPNPACVNGSVTVNGSGSGPASAYDWQFTGAITPTVNNQQFNTIQYPSSGTYAITLNYQSGSCLFPVTQNITINPNFTPSVTITANPGNVICAGQTVTFTATPVGGGTSPSYQWKRNGLNVGTNSHVFSSSTLNNGDIITVLMTSNDPCTITATATATAITMTVNPVLVPGVNITTSPSNIICSGQNVTFTANPTNPGSNPVYQWSLNGNPVGNGSAVYTSSTLQNGDVISVNMTSNAICAQPTQATSQNVTMTVIPLSTPTVSISAAPAGSICSGQNVTFTSTATNQGPTPTYQWSINGINTGSNSGTFSSNSLSNGDVVQVTLTSSSACLTSTTAFSNTISLQVQPITAPSVTITQNPAGSICPGQNVTYTATALNVGSNPVYQWFLNGIATGSNSSVFSSSTLNNGDIVSVSVNSSYACSNPLTTSASAPAILVTGNLTPSVTVSVSPSATLCTGQQPVFTANPVNGGTTPTWQWFLNGSPVGSNLATYSPATVNNGDIVTVTMISSISCVTQSSASSAPLTLTVLPLTPPSVTISAAPPGTICSGTSVTFTAAGVNSGANPQWQWTVNGNPAGTNAPTFTTSALNNGDQIQVTLTPSTQCPGQANATSGIITASVTPLLSPSVSLAASPSLNICQGQTLTFTASPVNGGTNPTYQWFVNGNPVGTNSGVYSSTTFSNGDIVSVTMSTSYACPTAPSVSSATQTINVGSTVVPGVSMSASPAGTLCQGQLLSLTAVPVNGGTNPQYTWFVNGIQVFAGADTYAANNLQTGDVVTVTLSSNAPCANPVQSTSAGYSVQMTTGIPVSVSISSNPANAICPGSSVTLTANAVNGGQSPSWQWFVNGLPAGSNSQTYTYNPSNGDAVTVQLTPDTICPLPAQPISAIWTAQVNPSLTPSVNIVQNPSGTACEGSLLSFSLTELNQGTSPQYNWTVNGVSVSQTSTFSSNTLQNGDIVGITLSSSAPCASPLTVQDNLTINMIPIVTPSVTITSNPPGPYCDGVPVTFTAIPVNGGPIPGYQWFINQTATITSADTFTVSTLTNGDQISVQMFSSAPCAVPFTASSPVIQIQIAPPLSISLTGDTLICLGEKADLTAQAGGGDGNYSYIWSNNTGNLPTQTIYPISSTTISVIVADGCGSTPATDALTITVIPGITAGYGYTPVSPDIFNNTVTLQDQSSPSAQIGFWNFGSLGAYSGTDLSIIFPSAGVYPFVYTVSDAFGCRDSVNGEIIIKDVQTFYIPEAFTPNGDGVNELFAPAVTNYDGYEMDIFGVWGQPIYHTGDSKPWDGTDSSGKQVQQGVYVYRIRLFAEGSEDRVVNGRVSVLR